MATPRAVQLERPEETQLLESHVSLQDIRGRGTETPSHLASDLYLRRMEEELSRVRNLLFDARAERERSKDLRRCSRLLDEAQQRLHIAIKKAGKHQRHRTENKTVTEPA